MRPVQSLFLLLGFCVSLVSQTAWEKHPGPVLRPGEPGSWDERSVRGGNLLYHDGLYRMWYQGDNWAGETRIGYAWSEDGVAWTKHAEPVIDLDPDGIHGWVYTRAAAPTVLFHEGQYHMWFAGNDMPNIALAYAVSNDGKNWELHADNPVIEKEGSEWETAGVTMGTVLFIDEQFHFWYTMLKYTGVCVVGNIGHLLSEDGVNWDHGTDALPVLTTGELGDWDYWGVLGPCVRFDGESYEMWFSGYNNDVNRIGYATSVDGWEWNKDVGNPILSEGGLDDWDVGDACWPSVLDIGGELSMWYSGYDQNFLPQIGLATAVPVDITPHTAQTILGLITLHCVYPNPFNPVTTIRFSLEHAQDVWLRVYSLSGIQIRELVFAHLDPGEHEVPWDAHDDCGQSVSTGIYLVQLSTGTTQRAIKVIYLE